MNHITSRQLQEYIDGIHPLDIEDHLRVCGDCRRQVMSFQHLERELRRIPPDRVPADLTGKILNRLGIRQSTSFGWMLMKNLAPLFALALIGSVIIIVFQYFGLYQGSQVQQSVEYSQSLSALAGEKISSGLESLNGWLSKYLSFAFAKNTYYLTIFLLLFFGAIALLDKFLLMPMTRRGRPSSTMRTLS